MSSLGSGSNRGIHVGPSLLGHSKAAIFQTTLHILAGSSVCRQLEIVDCGGAIERHVGDDTTLDPSPNERAEAYLDDMPAEEKNHSSAGAFGGDDGIDHMAEVLGGENVWQAGEKSGEGTIA